MRRNKTVVLALAALVWAPTTMSAQVRDEAKISNLAGGFSGVAAGSEFGRAVISLGDLDGSADLHLAVSAPFTSPLGLVTGSVYILRLDASQQVLSEVVIGNGSGGFTGTIGPADAFGESLANLDDIDGDGIPDLAATQPNGTLAAPAGVFVLFLDADGTVKSSTRFGPGTAVFGGASVSELGQALAFLGDRTGSGNPLLAIGDSSNGPGGEGIVWITSILPNGSSMGVVAFAEGLGGFEGVLADDEWFGTSLCAPGDLNGDGRDDLLVGAPRADEGDSNTGALWSLYMDCEVAASATVRNGSGANATRLTSINDPEIGSPWDADVDCSGHAPALAVIAVYESPLDSAFVLGGEILVDVTSPLGASIARPHSGGVASFSLGIPDDTALCGYTGSAQDIVLGAPQYELANAVDLVIGH